jgi:hypothetical protein
MHVYLVGWPNGTWSVLGFKGVPSDSDMTFSIDAIGDPSVASIFKIKRDGCGDFAFDFPRTPKSPDEKPELPDSFDSDLIPVRLYGDLKEAWEARQKELAEFDLIDGE